MDSGLSLDGVIDDFFGQLTQFTKGIKNDVASLQRSFENGYSLTPQEFREQLKQLEKRIKDIRDEADNIEVGSFGELSLAELAHRSWMLYQETTNGIGDLETHLRNYGYNSNKSFTSVVYERKKNLSPIQSTKTETASPLNTSKGNWLNFDYTITEETNRAQEEVFQAHNRTPRVSNKTHSTYSGAPLSFSPDSLSLKKKYDDVRSVENPITPCTSINDSFEFGIKTQEECMEVDEIAGTPCENLRASFATDFSIPFSQPPRLSFEVASVSFGSPFRSPNKKPEYSVFFPVPSPADPLVSKKEYEELQNSVKEKISLDALNRKLAKLRAAPKPQKFDENDQNKYLLHALEQLGHLEKKKMKDGMVFYCPIEKWNPVE
eukprot:g1538.t1